MSVPERMRDAAYSSNIPVTWGGAVGGYLHIGDPFHPWTEADWSRWGRRKKLPIVAMSHPAGRNPEADALAAVAELYNIGAARGCMTALDLEEAINPAYVHTYGAVMGYCGFKVMPYGSTSTLFQNPQLYGYWAAAPRADRQPYFYSHGKAVVRMTQYALDTGGKYDSSTVHWLTWTRSPWWR